jgi:hypothetical protein
MSRFRALKWGMLAGGLCLLVAGCGADDHDCICTENQSPFNTVTVTTPASCSSYAQSHAEQYSSCIESSASIVGPSWPLAKYIAPRADGLAAWLEPRLSGGGSVLLAAQLEEIGASRNLW